MQPHNALFRSPLLVRLVLMWFVLALGAAVASPIVKPRNEVLLCTSAGTVQVELQDDGTLSTQPTHEAHCPLCLPVSAPPVEPWQPHTEAVAAPYALPQGDEAPASAHHFASPPARAPPQA